MPGRWLWMWGLVGCAGAAASPEAVEGSATTAPEVRRGDALVARVAPSGTATITALAQGSEAFVGRLTIAPGAAVPEHRDETEEYIHVIAGSGTIHIDGTAYPIGAGDTVYMPANALVSYENGARELVALQVFAGPGPASKYDGWAPE